MELEDDDFLRSGVDGTAIYLYNDVVIEGNLFSTNDCDYNMN